jgi:hypothetical protein
MVADFLDIDQDLLAVAAEASLDAREEDHGGLAEWIASRQVKDKDALLARVVSGEGAAVQALLSRRFHRTCGGNEPAVATRTAAELWKAAGDRKAAPCRRHCAVQSGEHPRSLLADKARRISLPVRPRRPSLVRSGLGHDATA